MARHTLDEFECDEIYHALLERKQTLDKIAKKLEEDEGLPEAAQQVRKRIALYVSDDAAKKVGLIKRFQPQGDLTTTAHDEDRDTDGQQDAFGGGAETGGGHKPGETVQAKGKGSRKKGGGKTEAATATVKAADAKASDITDADFEIIPEGRRLGNGETPTDGVTPPMDPKVADAVSRLDSISDALKQGAAGISEDDYDAEAGRVLELLQAANPGLDVNFARAHVMGELRGAGDGNGHALAYFIDRMTALLKPEPDMPAPIAASGLSFAKPAPADEGDTTTGAILTDAVGG